MFRGVPRDWEPGSIRLEDQVREEDQTDWGDAAHLDL